MKKILFILAIFLTSVPALAQNSDKNSTLKSEQMMQHAAFEKTAEAFRVVGAGAAGTTSTTKGTYDTTPSTTAESTTYTFTTNYVDIINNTDQTLKLCVDSGFSTNTIYVAAYGSYRWAVHTTSLYYKVISAATGSIILIAQ